MAFFAGGMIGAFSGITGTGGAIFFTPLLLKMRWAGARHAAGLSLVVVMANSIFGLAGILNSSQFFDLDLTLAWVSAVAAGAAIGSRFGAFEFSDSRIQKVLGCVMMVSAFKLLSAAAGFL
jgi:hypothetical protein